MRLPTLVCILFGALLFSTPTSAGEILIDYAITTSDLTVVTPAITVIVPGNQISSVFSLSFTGTSISALPISGQMVFMRESLIISDLNLIIAGGLATITTPVPVEQTQVGEVAGLFLGGGVNFFGGVLSGTLLGQLHCQPGFIDVCPATLPASMTQYLTNSITTPQGPPPGITSVNWTSPSAVSGIIDTVLLSSPTTGTFTGTEISRTFIPEPNTTTALLAGSLGLAGLKAVRRRRFQSRRKR